MAQSTISRDLTALGEAVDEHLGDRVRLATVALHDQLVTDLSDADDWRVKRAAWDVHMDLVEWADISGTTGPEPRTAPENQTHELTETQQAHLETLREQARATIPERADTVAVPEMDDDAES